MRRSVVPAAPSSPRSAFSIPLADRMDASENHAIEQLEASALTFSIPLADRMDASTFSAAKRQKLAENFQYPFSGSNGCVGHALEPRG